MVEESDRDAKKKRPVDRNRIFDKVLSLSGLDKEDLKDKLEDQDKENDDEDDQQNNNDDDDEDYRE